MNPLINNWLNVIHKHGGEMAVTLLVSGRIITGMLTPIQRYGRWEREVTARALLDDGKFTLPSLELGEMSPEESQGIKDDWPEQEERAKDGFTYLAIRNAEIRDSGSVFHCPHLLVLTSAVAAFAIGKCE